MTMSRIARIFLLLLTCAAAAPGRADGPADEQHHCNARLGAMLRQEPLRFQAGSAEFTGTAARILDLVAELFVACPGSRLVVSGHTDAQGDEAENLTLSEARAARVVDELGRRGVSRDRAVIRAFGDSRPIADNATRYGRMLNRRIELEFVAPDQLASLAPAAPAGTVKSMISDFTPGRPEG